MTQKIRGRWLDHVLRQHTFRPEVYIETGTRTGSNLLNAANYPFRVLESIELNPSYFATAVDNCKNEPRIILTQGDSAVELPRVLAKYNEPVMCFLDAHYYDNPNITRFNFPLWDELQAIKNRDYEDLIVVDDLKVFGIERYDLGTDWVNVSQQSLTDFFEGKLKFAGAIGDTFVMSKTKP